jgi:hypothetical protein
VANSIDPARRTLLDEYRAFVRARKRWWWASVVVVAILWVALVLLGRTDAAPFIYTLY